MAQIKHPGNGLSSTIKEKGYMPSVGYKTDWCWQSPAPFHYEHLNINGIYSLPMPFVTYSLEFAKENNLFRRMVHWCIHVATKGPFTHFKRSHFKRSQIVQCWKAMIKPYKVKFIWVNFTVVVNLLWITKNLFYHNLLVNLQLRECFSSYSILQPGNMHKIIEVMAYTQNCARNFSKFVVNIPQFLANQCKELVF